MDFLFNWFRKRPEPYARDQILNDGLDIAMQWGEHWLQPIQKRLAILYPKLTTVELDDYDTICKSAMEFGHNIIYSIAEKWGKETNQDEFNKIFVEHYVWVNSKNLQRLYSQGMYYAWKDFGC